MTQTAYLLETLKQSFPTLQPQGAALSKKVVAKGAANENSRYCRDLTDLIDNPTGKDRSADTMKFAGAAARAGLTPDEVKAVLLNPAKAISAHCLDQADPERAADRVIDKAFAEMPSQEPVLFEPTPYTWIPAEELPPLDWMMGHWLLREEVSFVVAPGGSGKTTFLAAAALSLITGKNLLGKPVIGGPKRVWLWNLEDSIPMMTRSIQAAAKLYGIEEEETRGRLFLNTSRDGTPLCTTKRTAAGLEVSEPVHEALIAALKMAKIDVLIVDPFVSSHEGNENDNGEMDRVLKAWCKVAQLAGCAIVLCHHTSKAGSGEVNTNSARGAVSMTAAARVVLVLNKMTAIEANKLGVHAEERWRFVQVMMDKSNRAPVEKADWFRKASVELGPDDSAGVVEPWSPPQAADMIPDGMLERIIESIRESSECDRRESVQSAGWVGYVIAQVLGWERPASGTNTRGKVSKIITDLIFNGHVRKASAKGANSKIVPVIEVAE